MTKDLVIVGAGGQAKNIAHMLRGLPEWNVLGFVDDDSSKKGEEICSHRVLGGFEEVFGSLNDVAVAFAIGKSSVVERMVLRLREMNRGFYFPNLIDPHAVIDEKVVEMGEGNILNANVVFTTDIKIGSFNYFNRCSSVSHDVVIGSYCFINAGVHVNGGCVVGDGAWLGVNCTVIQYVRIGAGVIVGAGAVILKNVESKSVMVGNPARVLRYQD